MGRSGRDSFHVQSSEVVAPPVSVKDHSSSPGEQVGVVY
jgi:hypothetical protein